MRRIGPDMLDPELPQRSADLGWLLAVERAAGLGGEKVVRTAVGVEAHRQPVLGEHLVERAERRARAFLFHQKRRINLARRVVERHDQIERRLALEPFMPRAVLMQHHARQRPPLALAPVRPLALSLGRKPRPLQMQLEPRVAPTEAVVLDQMLVEVLDGEALIALAVEPLDLLGPVDRNPLAGRLAQPTIDKPGLALILVSPGPAPEGSLAHPQKLRRLLLVQLRRFPAMQNVQKHSHAHPLKGFRPAHPNPLKKGADLPDRSCAT
jgi:hypothetical protein